MKIHEETINIVYDGVCKQGEYSIDDYTGRCAYRDREHFGLTEELERLLK